jgi:2-polyprenyl-3-methyl-5-hydroxy-6-metoxy-1,4-benzoquinol methylase
MEEGNDLLSYYRDSYYHDHAADQAARDSMHLNDRILDVIERNANKGCLLDIGCGCGFFLSRARTRGWDIQGVDPSEQSIAKARELVGEAVSVGTLQDLNTRSLFDVVTMINVLDHMQAPGKSLSRSWDLLKPGGLLYLRFPNGLFHSSIIRMQTKLTDQPILNRLLVFHEYLFTPSFIKGVLQEQKYDNIRICNAHISGAALYGRSSLVRLLGSGLKDFLWWIVSFLRYVSGGHWLLGPSLEVTAEKNRE